MSTEARGNLPDGHVVTSDVTIGWHYGELPAQWLKSRGVHLEVRSLRGPGSAVDEVISGDAPVLLDSLAARLLPQLRAQRRDRRILISCDDDWWQPRDWAKARWRPGSEAQLVELAANLRAADGLVVPSPALAERMRHFGRPITVIPPALPRLEELPAPRPTRAGGGLRIGWAGTAWHWEDLNFIGPAVVEFLARRPEVTFVLGGKCVPSWVRHPRIELHHGWVPLPRYYDVLASLNLDAFVCPLVRCPFNEAKPCLKPLEAAGLGLPVIASRVGAYAEELTHEATAVLVGESTEAWLTALLRLVDDAALRAHLAARGRAWAATRTIDATGPRWADLWGG